MRYILSLAMIVVGFVIVLKAEWILRNVGRNAWAEQHLGVEGGSRLFYKLIGIGIMILGALILTGMIEGILMGTVGSLFGGFKK